MSLTDQSAHVVVPVLDKQKGDQKTQWKNTKMQSALVMWTMRW